ncbi:hypothetical protein Tco_0604068 [Tanacetum coccineum]
MFKIHARSWRDLPRDNPLVSVEVLRDPVMYTAQIPPQPLKDTSHRILVSFLTEINAFLSSLSLRVWACRSEGHYITWRQYFTTRMIKRFTMADDLKECSRITIKDKLKELFSKITTCRTMIFEVGDLVLLKVSPWKGVVRFGKKGQLAPSNVYDTFHVSNLKKGLANANLHVPLEEIKVDTTLHFVEEPVEIIDREVKSLKHSSIPIVKVHWELKRGLEDFMKTNYSLLLTSMCCDDVYLVMHRVSALVGCDSKRHKSSGDSSFNTRESREGSFTLNNTAGDEEDEVEEVRPSRPIIRDRAKRKGKTTMLSASSALMWNRWPN